MLARHLAAFAAVFACLTITGCATSRSEVRLAAPVVATVSGDRVAVIRSVTDERVFEQAPPDPSTPSLGFGGAAKATEEVKARAIARKRNTYGKALGDVLLEGDATVVGTLRDNLAAALADAGYRVVDAAEAGTGALVVDARIHKFWGWFNPGFWSIKLNANIATDLAIEGRTEPLVVSVSVQDSRQVATENGWMAIIDEALTAYRAEASSKVKALSD